MLDPKRRVYKPGAWWLGLHVFAAIKQGGKHLCDIINLISFGEAGVPWWLRW